MFSRFFMMIPFVSSLLFIQRAQATIHMSVTNEPIPVVGNSEVTLATCTTSKTQPAAEMSWYLGTLIDSVKISTNTVDHLDGTYTVTSNLIGTPSVQMNQQNVKCVVRHSTLKEDIVIEHTIVIHYPPQQVTVTPLENGLVSVFLCQADANPAAQFSWQRQDQTRPIQNDQNIKIEGNRLYILKQTSDLNGMYICQASNKYGTTIGHLYWQKEAENGGYHSEL